MFMHVLIVTGIEVTVDNSKVICKVILLSCTCDLPARAAVLNFTQFNGFYGCCRCKQKGICTYNRIHTLCNVCVSMGNF